MVINKEDKVPFTPVIHLSILGIYYSTLSQIDLIYKFLNSTLIFSLDPIQLHQKSEGMSRIVYPCAACKIQRRKCGDKCVLAPYFAPNDPHKFFVVHKLFGARNIAKILRDIAVENREDAVTSVVYEASVRVNDPIYGCTGAICRLQKEVLDLQSQLATVQAELHNTQANLSSLLTGFCNSVGEENAVGVVHQSDPYSENGTTVDNLRVLQDDEDPFGLWAPL
ncbi:hypothetical protein SUGI_0320880 [Cryptomeria japonica]|nr:hypothetical protein SUGI_0320880 [Cryptomeria japonica]